MNDTTRVMIVLSPVLWLVLSVVVHGYLARRDDEADVVVPAMSGAFFAVLALWVPSSCSSITRPETRCRLAINPRNNRGVEHLRQLPGSDFSPGARDCARDHSKCRKQRSSLAQSPEEAV